MPQHTGIRDVILTQPIETLHEGKFLRLVRRGRWEFVQRKGKDHAVIILALTSKNEVILIEQTRVPAGGRVLEYPAGLVGDIEGSEDETLEGTALRELHEETGYEAKRVEKIFSGPPSPGLASETITWFRACDIEKTGPGGGDGSEDISVHSVPLAEVNA